MARPASTHSLGITMQAEFDGKKMAKAAEERMVKSMDKCKENMATLRTGAIQHNTASTLQTLLVQSCRASPAILDRVSVDYFGTQTPLKALAAIKTTSASQLMVEAYDRTALTAIERAIIESGVGLTPNNDGQVIRLNVPPVTEDR
eukprot:2004-Heterococcus_DN1.PRE.1